MSRVEPEPQKRSNEARQQASRRPDPKPSKAEGDEQTVKDALRNQERKN